MNEGKFIRRDTKNTVGNIEHRKGKIDDILAFPSLNISYFYRYITKENICQGIKTSSKDNIFREYKKIYNIPAAT